ncbi:MAG: N-glycosyltransferase [Methanomassiliicoccales archaeon PtaU1.Bin124]|nr:MAG: N-glycosyltransferase [Methanomassiliicoccales archaeon PtaU1.Bin124]
MNSLAKVFAITVNWKRCDDTLACLDSLTKCGVEVQTVVVDNGSGDGSVERIRSVFPNAHVIANERNEGYAKAANQGVIRALDQGATHILLINNDAEGDASFLKAMMDGFDRHPNAGVLGCKIFYHGTDVIWYAGGNFNEWLGYTTHPGMDLPDDGSKDDRVTGFVTGCVMLVKAEVFRKIGLFDETMGMYSEDLDLCLRAKRSGYQSWYVPGAVARHKVSMSGGEGGSNRMTPFRSYYYSRNLLLAVAKNQRGLKLATCFYSQAFLLMPYYFFRIRLERSKGSFRRYLAGFLSGLRIMVGERSDG